MRFAVTEMFRDLLRASGGAEAYAYRRILQLVVIVGLIAPVFALLVYRLGRLRVAAWPGKIGLLGVGVSAIGFSLETISWHYLDTVPFLYQALRFNGLGLTLLALLWGMRQRRHLGASMRDAT
jgi:hypothetical protein